MSQIPTGWLMNKEGLETTPLATGFYDDIWYTSSRPLYFYQKDIAGNPLEDVMELFLEATPRKNMCDFFFSLLLWENEDKLSRLAIFMGTMMMKHQICRVIVVFWGV